MKLSIHEYTKIGLYKFFDRRWDEARIGATVAL